MILCKFERHACGACMCVQVSKQTNKQVAIAAAVATAILATAVLLCCPIRLLVIAVVSDHVRANVDSFRTPLPFQTS